MEIATLALDSAASTLNAGATRNIVIHSITGDGVLAAQGGQITLDTANPLTWNGTLQGTGTLSKKGAGALTLGSAGNAGFHLDSTSGAIILASESSAYGAHDAERRRHFHLPCVLHHPFLRAGRRSNTE